MLGIRSLITKALVAGGLATLLFGALTAQASADPAEAETKAKDTATFSPRAVEQIEGMQFTGLTQPAPEKPRLSDFTPESPSSGIGNLSGGTNSSNAVSSVGSFAGGRGGCSIQCITSGVAYAHGVGAELRVETDTFAHISIWVWSTDAPGGSASSASRVESFGTIFPNLKPGTEYSVMVEAKDYRGYRSYAFGSFTTLVRDVTVSFNRADLLELPYGENQLSAQLWLEGEWRQELDFGPYSLNAPIDPQDPSYLSLGIISASQINADRYLHVALQLWQVKSLWYNTRYHACEIGPGLYAEPQIDTVVYADCGMALTGAFATTELGENDLDKGLGVSSWTRIERETVLKVPEFGGPTPDYGAPLDFEVPVKIVVEYVAK